MRRKKSDSRFRRPVLCLLLAALLITAVAAALYQSPSAAAPENSPPAASPLPSPPPPSATAIPTAADAIESTTGEESVLTQAKDGQGMPVSMENTLFIGDSRTMGLLQYAGMDGATFFATVGMNVYKVTSKEVSVPGIGKLTLPKLLAGKQFTRIYIMLGINEVGYPLSSTVKKYGELIQSIQTAQPEALIFIQANLHVTKARSDRDEVINNPKIDALNERLSLLADNSRVFYLDANCVFDDENGALSEEKSSDSAHPLGRYYRDWGSWIEAQTGEILRNI